MNNINIVHCFFEQSGTFKNEFRKNNIISFDYDIRNDYNQTDYIIDLFAEIEKAYKKEKSIFDKINTNDLIFAFFPCIYFCQSNRLFFCANDRNFRNHSRESIFTQIIDRNEKRAYYYNILIKLCSVVERLNFRMIIENPYSTQHYLYNNFPYKPAIIDMNRNKKGDYFVKKTQYFFLNCTPELHYNSSIIAYKAKKVHSCGGHIGSACDKERSEISPIYAQCFINDYILSKKSQYTELNLFNI